VPWGEEVLAQEPVSAAGAHDPAIAEATDPQAQSCDTAAVVVDRADASPLSVVRVLFWVSVMWLCAGAIATASDIGSNSQHSWVGSDIALLVVSALIVHAVSRLAAHRAPFTGTMARAPIRAQAPAAV
jgi:hypothetical protein